MHIFKVTATDGDKDRPENIVYFLTGQGIDTDRPDQSKFDINKTTGEIFVLKVINTVALIYNSVLTPIDKWIGAIDIINEVVWKATSSQLISPR